MNILLEHILAKKNSEETWPKMYLDQDQDTEPELDPDIFKSRIRIQ
jgi:hypothetical protein